MQWPSCSHPLSLSIQEETVYIWLFSDAISNFLKHQGEYPNIGGQFLRASEQRMLLSNIKQTTSQNAYMLSECLTGN